MSVVGPWYPPDVYDNDVLSRAYDPVNEQLNTTTVVGTATTGPASYELFVWSHVFDPETNTIRIIEV